MLVHLLRLQFPVLIKFVTSGMPESVLETSPQVRMQDLQTPVSQGPS